MSLSQESIERAFEELLSGARRHPGVGREFERTLREFLAGRRRGSSTRAQDLAARRHAEWFLLERPSDALEVAPALGLEPPAFAAADLEAGRDALLASFASVFEITGVRSGEGVWVRDLAGQGEYPLEEVDASRALEPGDLLVGRIFPVGDALFRISHASGFFRDPELLKAVRTDLTRAREGRRGVLRLSQRDLEAMFFARDGEAAGELSVQSQPSAVEVARRCLTEGGLDPSDVDDILAELASEPYDPQAILPGAGDRLGRILDMLAFETDIDLEAARRALANAWPELSRGPVADRRRSSSPSQRQQRGREAPNARRIERALSEFDARRARGDDLESVFSHLERELDLDADPATEEAPAPDFPGVVGAMVVEFLWDVERERGPERARRWAAIAGFAQFAESQGVFENLGARDLLLYACLWLPEHAGSSHEASRCLEALVEFAAWAEERHGVQLSAALAPSREGLARSLPRIAAANAALRLRLGELTEGGELLGYEGLGRARTPRGEPREVELVREAAELAQPGDFLRAQRSGSGPWRAVVLYPPETALLASL